MNAQNIGPKEQLMEAAIHEFATKGFEGASLREICQTAQQNVSAVKYYFGGKEELYKTCLKEFSETRLAEITRILVRPNNSEEFQLRLKLFSEDFILSALQHEKIFKLVLREIENQSLVFSEVFNSSLLKIHSHVLNYFNEGIKDGLISKNIDGLIITSAFLDSLVQRIRNDHLAEKIHGCSLKDPKFRQHFLDQYLSIFFNGIKN